MKILIFKVVMLVLYPCYSWAYQCPLEEAYFKEIIFEKYKNADLVAIITPRKIEHYEFEEEYLSYKLVQAKVVKSWKGRDTKAITIKDVNSMISGYLPLKEGSKYIVYADGPGDDGFYEVYTCDIETLGHVTRKQKLVLNKIKSNKLKIAGYYNVFSRLESFINHDLFETLDISLKNNSIHVAIELDEYAEDWVKNSVIRFIKQESAALGVDNAGKFILSVENDRTTITWVHPKS